MQTNSLDAGSERVAGSGSCREVVCHCHGVTAAEIYEAIGEGGATSVEEIGRSTEAGTSCKGCHCRLNRMLLGLSPNCGRFGLCGQCGCAQVLCVCDAA